MSVAQRVIDATKRFLRGRKIAYHACFPKDSPTTDVVLDDLARFCRANVSTFHTDPHVAARMDGRREVWLRIQQHLNLSPDEMMAVYAKGLKEKPPT